MGERQCWQTQPRETNKHLGCLHIRGKERELMGGRQRWQTQWRETNKAFIVSILLNTSLGIGSFVGDTDES